MRTLYYTNFSNQPHYTEEQCRLAEAEETRQREEWNEIANNGNPNLILDKLKSELSECLFVKEGTIATCSYDTLRIKKMVGVCSKFVEENKEYLNYY